MPSTRPPARWARAGVAAVVATACGAAGHVLAGYAFSAAGVGVALVVAWAAACLLTARERSWAWIAAQQVGTQLLVHAGLASATDPIGPGLLPHDLMLHAHVLAGLLAAALLRRGEHRLWARARRLVARIAAWARSVGCPLPAPAGLVNLRPARSSDRVGPLSVLRHSLAMRAPPHLV